MLKVISLTEMKKVTCYLLTAVMQETSEMPFIHK